MEKYCLKWNEFEGNIRQSFRKLREEERLFDVTLATDDGQHIQAHKMILSAGSDFFSDIFMKTNQNNLLIYLKGINSAELEHVTDFLYDGETFITQEELKMFLETAKELKIKGLQGYLQGIGQKESEKINENKNDELQIEGLDDDLQGIVKSESETINGSENTEIAEQECILDSLLEFDTRDGSFDKMEENNSALNTDQKLDIQIEQMIENKHESSRSCRASLNKVATWSQ